MNGNVRSTKEDAPTSTSDIFSFSTFEETKKRDKITYTCKSEATKVAGDNYLMKEAKKTHNVWTSNGSREKILREKKKKF